MGLSLVREDRDGPTSGVPAILPGVAPGSYVGTGEPLKASKREAPLEIRRPKCRQGTRRPHVDYVVDRSGVEA